MIEIEFQGLKSPVESLFPATGTRYGDVSPEETDDLVDGPEISRKKTLLRRSERFIKQSLGFPHALGRFFGCNLVAITISAVRTSDICKQGS